MVLKFVPRNSEICTPKFWFPKGKFFQLWVFHCFHGFVERNLYSWNVAMIIWSANKAGYIIPGLWSTVDSSHNAVAALSLSQWNGIFFFSQNFMNIKENELHYFETSLLLKLFILLDIWLITVTWKLIQASQQSSWQQKGGNWGRDAQAGKTGL